MHKPVHSLTVSRPTLVAALFIAFGLVLATALLNGLSAQEIAAADRQVERTQRTLASATQMLATVSDAAIAARSAMLTRDEKYIGGYNGARTRYARELEDLRAEYGRARNLSPLFVELQQFAESSFATLDRALVVLRERGTLPALDLVDVETGQQPIDEMRKLIVALQRQHFAELADHSHLAGGRAELMRALNFGLVIVAAALAVWAAWWLLRSVRELNGMIRICAWTRRVEWQGRWVSFEEFLSRRFNVLCSHGICDEAAEKVRKETEEAPVAAQLRRS